MKLGAAEEEFLKLLSLDDFGFMGSVLVAVGRLRLNQQRSSYLTSENNKAQKFNVMLLKL